MQKCFAALRCQDSKTRSDEVMSRGNIDAYLLDPRTEISLRLSDFRLLFHLFKPTSHTFRKGTATGTLPSILYYACISKNF